MATTNSPLVIGVFRDRALVDHAVRELRHAGFRDVEMRVWGQGISQGGFLESRIPGTARHSTRILPIALLEAPVGVCL